MTERGHRTGKLDLRGTSLGEWMIERKLSVAALAKRLELHEQNIYRLIGHRNGQTVRGNALILPPADILQLVSLETDIEIGRLAEDAIRIDMERKREVA